ncbi:MAG: ABC transporter permease [Anaerolineales bacterium]|jgi:simple sugar transport system permease protein
MAANLVPAKERKPYSRNRLVIGLVLVATGLLILLLFGLHLTAGQQATYQLTPRGDTNVIPIPALTLPVQPSIYILALIAVFLGGWHLARGIRSTGLLLGMMAFCFVAAFLTWATIGQTLDLVGMLNTSMVRATPIALAAMCGVISERSAVINIGLEGIMLTAAMTAVVSATLTHNLYIGLLVAMLTGGVVGAIHAVLVIRFKVDQIVSGTAVNIIGTGATNFVSARFLETNIDQLNNSGTFPNITIPLLVKIPIVGPVLFENNLIFYLTVLLVVVLYVVLFFTPWGLRSRAVGEHPKAADTLGINVYLMRYVNVILGGVLAGIGGAYFTIGSIGRFDRQMTNGKGFIGLAAMIFGKWNPIGAYGASLIFGFADSLQVKMQILGIPVPSEFLGMAPYLVTMIVLAGVVGRARPPAADGQVYEKQ